MHALILNIYYYPPDVAATSRIIRDLADFMAEKHDVTVLAGRPSYNPEEYHPYYLFRRRWQGKVNVERVGSTAFHRRRMGGRATNFLLYLAFAFLRALFMRPKPDAIIAMTDPPVVNILAAVVSAMRRVPYVYNIRDLHPDGAIAAGMMKSGLVTKVWDRLHRWAMLRADLVIVLGEDMKQRVLDKGVDPGRVEIVRDGATPFETATEPDHPVIREIRGDFDFVVVYGGNLGSTGHWDALLYAARCLEPEGVGFVFIGDGVLRQSLEQQAQGLGNVRFLPFYPEENLSQVLGAADLHAVTLKPGLEGLSVPSKLYPILMAGRPVLAITPLASDAAHIVRKYKCGVVADPDKPDQLVASMRRVLSCPQALEEMASQARDVSHLFDRNREFGRFLKLIEQVGGRR